MQRALPPRSSIVLMIALSGGAHSHALGQQDDRRTAVSPRAMRAMAPTRPGLALSSGAALRLRERPADALDPLADGLLRRARPASLAAARDARATVSVSDKTITEADLSAGEFMGQAFTLSPETTFDINDGGVMGPVGDTSSFIARPFDFRGSTVNINFGGHLVSQFTDQSVVSNIVLNVFDGGSVGNTLATVNADMNITGGSVGDELQAFFGSTVNISGGSVGISFQALDGSAVNLFVREASLDGVDLDLMLGETIEITQRGGSLLEAALVDGSFFDLMLNETFVSSTDFVSPAATLTVTRVVPAPGAATVLGLAGAFAFRRRRAKAGARAPAACAA